MNFRKVRSVFTASGYQYDNATVYYPAAFDTLERFLCAPGKESFESFALVDTREGKTVLVNWGFIEVIEL
ncbi:hypothetical protein DSECCO2_392550 [anaerobic digester metagenome]